MTDTPPPGEPPRDPAAHPPPNPNQGWPDFSAGTGGGAAPPSGPGQPGYGSGPAPGYGSGPGYGAPGPGPGYGAPGYGPPGYGPPGYGQYWQPGTPPPPPMTPDDRTMAMMAHLGGILFGFLPSLIVYLMKKDTSPYVRHQAAEALNFQITMAIASVISSILIIVLVGFVLIFAVMVLNIVYCAIAGVAANKGEPFEYPSWMRIKMVT